jgi:hypothetical protein
MTPLTISSPAANTTVSGTIQITGNAGSGWVNVAAYSSSGTKIATDVAPSNGSYSLSLNTTQLPNGSDVIQVTAFSVAAGQSGGTSTSISETLNVQNVSPVLFKNFDGVNDGFTSTALGIGWVRGNNACTWPTVEPSSGTFDFSTCDTWVEGINQKGAQIVMILEYTPSWSGGGSGIPSVSDWTTFVQTMVTRYSAAPFNVHYYEVWNEPTQAAGFWSGTDQQYVDILLNPAAPIIRAAGGYVVAPAWPISNSISELISLLNYDDAIVSVDYISIHYVSNSSSWQQLHTAFPTLGIWQTEFGYSTQSGFLTSNYNDFLTFALQSGWGTTNIDPNAYKMFWWPDSGTGGLEDSTGLTEAGQELVNLVNLYGNTPLSLPLP